MTDYRTESLLAQTILEHKYAGEVMARVFGVQLWYPLPETRLTIPQWVIR